MTPALLVPRAQAEQLEAARWIAQDSPAARRFLETIARLADRIGTFPQSGVNRLDLAPPAFRFCIVTGFPYLLVYNADRDPPEIVAILHGARDLPDVLKDLGPGD